MERLDHLPLGTLFINGGHLWLIVEAILKPGTFNIDKLICAKITDRFTVGSARNSSIYMGVVELGDRHTENFLPDFLVMRLTIPMTSATMNRTMTEEICGLG